MRHAMTALVPAQRTWIFDCDGVLLDSNRVKTEAFRELAEPYGTAAADALVAHHLRTGGQSRFLKARYLHEVILQRQPSEAEVQAEAHRYGDIVRSRLATCPLVPGVRGLLSRIPPTSRKFVVSGGLEEEVAWALEVADLARHFDGIFGSPRKKDEIFGELAGAGDLVDAVYLGDSQYDHEVAERFGVPFVFVSGVSEFAGWREYFAVRPEVRVVTTLEQLP